MGSKHIKNFKEKFLEKGLMPLAEIKNAKDKIPCMDKDGYKYLLSYHGGISDKRTKEFDKWNKNNPFKPYNMRLLAKKLEPFSEILSTDEELFEATTKKVKFKCPLCGETYEKKWCHWISQEKGKHICRKCANKKAGENLLYTYKELQNLYAQYDFILLSDYTEYLNNGYSYARLTCLYKDGYKYTVNLHSLKTWKNGISVRYSGSNIFAVDNLQKYCDDNNIKVKILSQVEEKGQTFFNVQCECGNVFKTLAYKITSKEKIRCEKCIKKESNLELKTRLWLQEHNISFIQEYRFEDCKYKRALPFDFKVIWKEQTFLIEVDGGQHYYTTQWTNEEDLKLQKIKDNIKTNYCEQKGYNLIRIPFWTFKNDKYKEILSKTFLN